MTAPQCNQPDDGPSSGVYDVWALHTATQCAAGNHAWLPWLQIAEYEWVTVCAHCHEEQHYAKTP